MSTKFPLPEFLLLRYLRWRYLAVTKIKNSTAAGLYLEGMKIKVYCIGGLVLHVYKYNSCSFSSDQEIIVVDHIPKINFYFF